MARELSCGSEYASDARRIQAGGISLTEAVYPPGARLPPHYHSAASLCLVLHGCYEERFEATSLRLEAGSVVFSTPGQLHSDVFGRHGGRCFTVEILACNLEEWTEEGGASDWLDSKQAPPSRYAFELYADFASGGQPCPGEVEDFTLALLDDVRRGPRVCTSGRPPSWLVGIRDRVHEEFRTLPTLEQLASDAAVHRVHAARQFRRHFDCTVGEYARRRRVEYACTRLREDEPDLSAVAYDAGFADQAHMTRSFRRTLGMTPGEFRSRFGRSRTTVSA